MATKGTKVARRVGLEVLGWTLVVAGIAALVLPGPGLLGLLAGLVVLSQQYEWAERRVEPMKRRAFRAAAEGVQTWPRVAMSTLAALLMTALGVFWTLQPETPGWWPFPDSWWLFGGWPTGASLIFSALIALALIVYSYRRWHGVEPQEAAAQG